MIDQTTPTTASPLDRPSSLRLPLQAAPIDRSQSAASAVTSEGGVEAAIFGLPSWTDDLFNIATKAAPLIAGALSDRTLKRDIFAVEWSR
jgi:hypothetical protein